MTHPVVGLCIILKQLGIFLAKLYKIFVRLWFGDLCSMEVVLRGNERF